jgi:cell fate regulator YaaT (PSP1 superfamily)
VFQDMTGPVNFDKPSLYLTLKRRLELRKSLSLKIETKMLAISEIFEETTCCHNFLKNFEKFANILAGVW